METIVEKSGVCSAILLLLLGSTSQLRSPIKYLPFPNKRYSMWPLSLLTILWKRKKGKLQNAACGTNNSAPFSLWWHWTSLNDMMHRTMSRSQPSIAGCGRAGPFMVFIFTQSLWHFGVSNTKMNLPQARCKFLYRNDYVHLQKVTVKPPTENKHKSHLGLTD